MTGVQTCTLPIFLAVGAPDPIGLTRLARGLATLADLSGGRPVEVVLNRVRPTLGWPERDIVAMVQGFPGVARVMTVPDDRGGADRALAAGRPITDAEGPAARALRGVVERVVPQAAKSR